MIDGLTHKRCWHAAFKTEWPHGQVFKACTTWAHMNLTKNFSSKPGTICSFSFSHSLPTSCLSAILLLNKGKKYLKTPMRLKVPATGICLLICHGPLKWDPRQQCLVFISVCQLLSARKVHYFPIWCFKCFTAGITGGESGFGTHKLDRIVSQSL